MRRRPSFASLAIVLTLGTAPVASLAACRSFAVEDGKAAGIRPLIRADDRRDAAAAILAAPDAAHAPEPVVVDEPPLTWGTRPPRDGVLFPVVDGMCIHGEIFALENGALFAYGSPHGASSRGGLTTTVRVGDHGLEPQPDAGFGSAFQLWSVSALGGHYPDRLWAIIDVSSRMVEAAELRVGTTKAEDWKIAVESGTKLGDAGNAATANTLRHDFGRPLVMPDGSTLVPEMLVVPSDLKPETASYAFRLVSPAGALVAKPKVPGSDLAEIAFGARYGGSTRGIATLANGEVLGIGRKGNTAKLVRWSPAQPVDDLPLRNVKTTTALRAGKSRAFVQLDGALFVYDGTKVEPVKLTPKLTAGFAWAVGKDDTLFVALPSNTLLVETTQGAVTEEPLPAFGRLEASPLSGTVWLVSDHEHQLHRRTTSGATGSDGAWEPVVIPPPPFGNALRGSSTIENLQILGADDVFVNTRRFEKGWGWSQPEPYRAIYRTKRPRQVLRCQDVRNAETGHGVYTWAPAADDSCTTPFVVVMREETKEPAKTYPGLAASLRGKTEYGAKLAFVSFDGRGGHNLGIPMSDTALARKLATYVSKSLDVRADVVCGRPDATRQLAYDVAKGTLEVGQSSPGH